MSSIFSEINKLSESAIADLACLTRAGDGSGWVCPNCGGGTHGKGYGIKQHKRFGGYHWYCNSPSHDGNHSMSNTDILCWAWGLDPDTDKAELARELEARFEGRTLPASQNTSSSFLSEKSTSANQFSKSTKNFSRLYSYWRQELPKFLETQPNRKWRGLTFNTLFDGGVGYNAKYHSLIFPIDEFNFFKRSVEGRQLGLNGGGSWENLYRARLTPKDCAVYITEGAIDCLSCMQAFADCKCHIGFVAAGSANCADYAIAVLSELFEPQQTKMIWVSDSDMVGGLAAQDFHDAMTAKGFEVRVVSFPPKVVGVDADGVNLVDKVDANDFLQEHGESELFKILFRPLTY